LIYITKPFQAEEVLARVRTHLSIRNLQYRLEEKNRELSDALNQLRAAQHKIVHQEKMAALGQLVAGIAHEINTPAGSHTRVRGKYLIYHGECFSSNP